MAKDTKTISATIKDNDGNVIAGKRAVEMYATGNAEMDRDANQGLTLRVQNSIRTVLKERHGLKVKTSGGKEIDYSDIEEA